MMARLFSPELSLFVGVITVKLDRPPEHHNRTGKLRSGYDWGIPPRASPVMTSYDDDVDGLSIIIGPIEDGILADLLFMGDWLDR